MTNEALGTVWAVLFNAGAFGIAMWAMWIGTKTPGNPPWFFWPVVLVWALVSFMLIAWIASEPSREIFGRIPD